MIHDHTYLLKSLVSFLHIFIHFYLLSLPSLLPLTRCPTISVLTLFMITYPSDFFLSTQKQTILAAGTFSNDSFHSVGFFGGGKKKSKKNFASATQRPSVRVDTRISLLQHKCRGEAFASVKAPAFSKSQFGDSSQFPSQHR